MSAFRDLAAAWHGGQTSALHAYASTGTATEHLIDEVREVIELINGGNCRANGHVADLPMLKRFADAIERGALGADPTTNMDTPIPPRELGEHLGHEVTVRILDTDDTRGAVLNGFNLTNGIVRFKPSREAPLVTEVLHYLTDVEIYPTTRNEDWHG